MPSLRQRACLILFTLFALDRTPLFASSLPPRITVILADHLTLTFIQETRLPHLARLRDTGQLALLSSGLPHPPDPAPNVYATFTAGDVVNTKNDHLGLLDRQIFANGAERSVTFVRFGDAAGRLPELDALIAQCQAARGNKILMLCSPVPPQDTRGNWTRLTPLLVSGLGPNGGTLVTDTTHTPGLVALRDLAPTILAWASLPIPNSMTGAPARSITVPNRTDLLARMDRLTDFNQRVLLIFAWFFGLSAGLAIAGGGWVVATGGVPYPVIVRFFIRAVVATPLALLLAPIFVPSTLPLYALELFVSVLICALIPSLGALYTLTVLVLVIDGLTGTHLVASSPISGYWLSGIRFYGIGNEYMGALIGMTLVAPFLTLPPGPSPSLARSSLGRGGQEVVPLLSEGGARGGSESFSLLPSEERTGQGKGRGMRAWRFFLPSFALAAWYLFVWFTLSYPAFGAKAGGAVTACVTFLPAWFAVCRGRRVGPVSFLGSALVGFGLVFALALLARKLGAPPTHIQSAVDAARHHETGYIAHIAVRKAKMAVKTALTPGGFVTVAALIPIYLLWAKTPLKARVQAFLASRPDYASALQAGFWGLLATVLFNDSGGVAFIFFFGAITLPVLHDLVKELCESSGSTSVMSASASPSATN